MKEKEEENTALLYLKRDQKSSSKASSGICSAFSETSRTEVIIRRIPMLTIACGIKPPIIMFARNVKRVRAPDSIGMPTYPYADACGGTYSTGSDGSVREDVSVSFDTSYREVLSCSPLTRDKPGSAL